MYHARAAHAFSAGIKVGIVFVLVSLCVPEMRLVLVLLSLCGTCGVVSLVSPNLLCVGEQIDDCGLWLMV